MAEDSVRVIIEYIEAGKAAVETSLNSLTKQFQNLGKVNASLLATTGKVYPQFAQQAAAINLMGGASAGAAQKLVQLRQEGSLFSQAFSGDARKNLAALTQQFGASTTLFGKNASTLRSRMEQELGMIQVYTGRTDQALRSLTQPERWRIMGHVFSEEITQMSTKLINWGKNLQWVGRQMMVGLTLPLILVGREAVMSFLTLNRSVTQLQKYLLQTGVDAHQFAELMNEDNGTLMESFNRISEEAGLFRDEVIDIASAWAAAGYDLNNGLQMFTELTAQLMLLTQGEIDQAGAIEFVRSVQKSWGYDTAQTVDQVHRLTLIANETSLTMQELAQSIPIVSSSASLLGLSASETAAALAGMREKGVTASQAANTLKFSLNRLINPTTKAKEAFNALANAPSLEKLLFTPQGEGRGIQGLQDIAKVIGQLSAQKQGILVGTLFGGYRADRMLKLIQAMNEGTSQFAVGLQDALDQTGRAAELWDQQLAIVQDSAAQKFKVMRVELVTLAQKLGADLFPYVEKLGRMLLDLLKKFEETSPAIQHMVVGLGVLLAAIGPVTYLIAQLTEATGMLSRVFLATPLRAIFSMKVQEDPFGLLAIAKSPVGKTNPVIQMLAGLPAMNMKISDTSKKAAAAIAGEMDALAQRGVVDAGTATAIKTSILSRLGVGPDLAKGLATGLNEANSTVIKGLDDLQFTFNSKLKQWESTLSPGRAVKGNIAQYLLAGMAPGSATEKEIADTIAVVESRAITQAASSGEVKAASQTFMQKLGAFMKGSQIKALAPPGAGGGTAGLFNIMFGSPIKLIAAIVIITGLVSHLQDIMKGAASSFSEAGDILGAAFSGLIKSIIQIFGYGEDAKSQSDIWVAFGKAVGDLALTGARVVKVFAEIIAKIISFVAGVGSQAIELFINLGKAIVALVTVNPSQLFASIINIFPSLIGGVTTLSSAVAKLVAVFIGLFIINKLAAAFTALQAAFRLFAEGIIQIRTGLLSVSEGMAVATEGLTGFLNPWILIPTLVIGAMFAVQHFFHKEDELAKAAAGHMDEFADAINSVNEALSTGGETANSWLPVLETLKSTTADIAKHLISGFSSSELKSQVDETKSLVDSLTQQLEENPTASNYYDIFQQRNDATDKLIGLQKDLNGEIENESNLHDIIGEQLTLINDISAKGLKDFKKQIHDNMEFAQQQVRVYQDLVDKGHPEFADDLTNARALLVTYQITLDEIKHSGLAAAAAWDTQLNKVNRWITVLGGSVKDLKGASSELTDAIASQIDQLASRVQNALTSAFEDKMQSQLDALDEAQQRQLDAFDARSQHRMDAFDKEAAAQTGAIDKKIAAMDKENAKEEWLQKQQDYRRQREELLRKAELSDAISFVEQQKAINEGRYDDARLLALQSLSDQTDYNNQIKDLDKQQNKDVKQHNQDKKKARLEKEKERLQKQLDQQRQALQDQLDAQKQALQDQLDAQKQALQDQLDAQKDYLNNLLDELNDFSPKNKKQWREHYDAIKELAKNFGIDVSTLNEKFFKGWHTSIDGMLNDAYRDAYAIAAKGGAQVGQAGQAGLDQAASPSTEEDLAVYGILSKYLEAQKNAAKEGGLTPQEMLMWMHKITSALKGASRQAKERLQGYTDTRVSPRQAFHTGGDVKAVHGHKEVPARLLPGEYVVQKKAVKKYGKRFMDSVNDVKFHTGGFVNPRNVATGAIVNLVPQMVEKTGLGSVYGGILKGITHNIGKSVGHAILGGLKGALAPPSVGHPTGKLAAEASTPSGPKGRNETPWGFITTPAENWIKNVITRHLATSFGTVSIRPIEGTSTYSQHAYGNAVDNFWGSWSDGAAKANPKLFPLWDWAKANAAKLHARLIIFNGRQFYGGRESAYTGTANPHMGHVHADFNPPWAGDPYTGGYPVGHTGGIFTGKKFKQFGNLKFQAPAMIQPGEALLSKNLTSAFNKIGATNQTPVNAGDVNIAINIDEFYGDDNSYRKLYQTLERVGNKISRERGHNGTIIRAGGRA